MDYWWYIMENGDNLMLPVAQERERQEARVFSCFVKQWPSRTGLHESCAVHSLHSDCHKDCAGHSCLWLTSTVFSLIDFPIRCSHVVFRMHYDGSARMLWGRICDMVMEYSDTRPEADIPKVGLAHRKVQGLETLHPKPASKANCI